jgi:hypothetical protein
MLLDQAMPLSTFSKFSDQAVDACPKPTWILLGDKYRDIEHMGSFHQRPATLQHSRAVIDMRHQFRLHIDNHKYRIRLHFP